MWHPIVTCERCGHVHECVRLIAESCSFTLICHGCETVLAASVSGQFLANRRLSPSTMEHINVVGFAAPSRTRWTEEHGVS